MPKKKQPTLKAARKATSFPVRKKQAARAAPAPRMVGRAAGSGRQDMKVAPTQQVTVNPTLQAGGSGLGGLAAKIEEMLRNQRGAKARKAQKSALSGAKKQYSQYRKKAMSNLKDDNKAIKKRESAKIKRLPVKERAAARKKLAQMLKERVARLKKKLPGRVGSAGQLKNLMAAFRTLKV